MKILMIHPHDIYSPMEPWTIRIVKFAQGLQKRGHEVKIIHYPYNESTDGDFGRLDIVAFERKNSIGAFIRNTKRLCELSDWADILHFQKAHFYSTLPALLAAYRKKKAIHYDWDDWEEKIFYASIHKAGIATFLAGISFRMLERCLPFLVDSVSVSSKELGKMTVERGACPEKIFWAPVGADPGLFGAAHEHNWVKDKYSIRGSLLILYHGQLHSCQYADLFLKAAKIISDKSVKQPLKFMVLGDGSKLAKLKELSQALRLEDKVVFTGFVMRREIPSYIAAADICVAPFEDNRITRCKSPLKIAEYLASGKAIVASDVGEVRNMLEGAGLLVRPNSEQSIAEGILKLIDDERLRKRLSLSARQKAEATYNWTFSVKNLEKAYQSALS